MYVFYLPLVIKKIYGLVESRKEYNEYNDVYHAKYDIIYIKLLYHETSNCRDSLKKSQNVLIFIMVYLEAQRIKDTKIKLDMYGELKKH